MSAVSVLPLDRRFAGRDREWVARHDARPVPIEVTEQASSYRLEIVALSLARFECAPPGKYWD